MKFRDLMIILVIIFLATYFTLGSYTSLIISGLYLLFVLQFKYKKDISGELIISALFALLISFLYPYEYVGQNYFLGPINIYPLVLWTLGLVLVREFYEYIGNKWFVTSILYVIGILTVEYIGFHILGVRTVGDYPGVFGLDIIHGPPVIHYFYILAGPVYLLVTKVLKIR